MIYRWRLLFIALLFCGLGVANSRAAERPANCDAFKIDDKASDPLQKVTIPPTKRCVPRMSNGFPLPDLTCTPGASNPTLPVETLRNPEFKTECVRNDATTDEQKAVTYAWYAIKHPDPNSGAMQTCELDHLISLELGGSDQLENIWPQCGPAGVVLVERYFKRKDTVENYLAKQVKNGLMNLSDAQKGIVDDWTRYLSEAEKACPRGECAD
jgi:hypothetical protein